MKKYISPFLETVKFDVQDIITESEEDLENVLVVIPQSKEIQLTNSETYDFFDF